MDGQRKQSSTTHPILFFLVSAIDHVTAVTGATPTVTLSKDGGAFAAAAGAVSEIGSGWYALAGNATDRATTGALAVHVTATGADPVDLLYEIVLFDPFADPTTARYGYLDAAISGRATPADVLAQATAALAAIDLDHLIQVTAGAEEPTDGSYLDQIMHKDGSQTFDASTDSLEALGDKLNSTSISFTYPIIGTSITVLRGDTFSGTVSSLGDISARTKLWFTAKSAKGDTDAQAVIQILETKPAAAGDGLQRLNGATTTAAWGSLTVTDEAAGNVTIALSAAATAVLREQSCYYDLQMLTASGVTTLTSGQLDVNLDVTVTVS